MIIFFFITGAESLFKRQIRSDIHEKKDGADHQFYLGMRSLLVYLYNRIVQSLRHSTDQHLPSRHHTRGRFVWTVSVSHQWILARKTKPITPHTPYTKFTQFGVQSSVFLEDISQIAIRATHPHQWCIHPLPNISCCGEFDGFHYQVIHEFYHLPHIQSHDFD